MSSATSPGSSPGTNEKILFWASFFTLIAAGIGFSVRAFILKDWGNQFGFTQSELGAITGGGLVGFGIAIIFFSFCADQFGYGKLMLVAFLLHASSAVVTFAATPVFNAYGKEGAHWCLIIGMWLFALGNGTCEAVINPLTATLFPRNKTHWLNILHAGWPLGLILGALIVLGFKQAAPDVRWEIKLGVFLVPVLLYGLMMFNKPFPHSEAKSSGVSLGTTLLTILSPVLLFLFLMQALVGYVELGTDSWIGNITERVLQDETKALLAFIWTNALMFTLRFFAGPIVERINPVGLLFASALLGTAGLFMLGQDFTNATWPWMFAVTIYGLGKTFYWPTLLGTISERFPKGGALALGISGGIGMISAGLLGSPGIGYTQDYFAVQKLKETSPAAYARYKAPDASGFPVFTSITPDQFPPVAGLDNAKLKVFDDWGGVIDPTDWKRKEGKTTTLESDLETVERLEKENKPVEKSLKENLTGLIKWWDAEGRPNYATDKDKLAEARLYGAKQALLYTAVVPALLAVGFLLLILYFMMTGGYKQIHLHDTHPPMEEY
ncbi:MFS transporter [Frigoriglobus tundricola]|uniref:Putative MFS-type transporter n=1 Tax=Frigoriglobus tundricola TaxID=2774151 RepID=A0A6M5YKM0_9BACT|nr:MFS transporter [Frigoriglobus tundricola]QJW93823.1 putative MFS-type transporter [Frigoriglobus tundricola]